MSLGVVLREHAPGRSLGLAYGEIVLPQPLATAEEEDRCEVFGISRDELFKLAPA